MAGPICGGAQRFLSLHPPRARLGPWGSPLPRLSRLPGRAPSLAGTGWATPRRPPRIPTELADTTYLLTYIGFPPQLDSVVFQEDGQWKCLLESLRVLVLDEQCNCLSGHGYGSVCGVGSLGSFLLKTVRGRRGAAAAASGPAPDLA
ncbi:uncharacterized protein LOC144323319 [Canis aureus]